MIKGIVNQTPYGEVLEDAIHLKNPRTFLSLIKDLSSVSFCDCSVDSKGAAFEYYVRATLKGKKLGQYFTPRELVQVMNALIGENKIVNAVMSNTKIKVLEIKTQNLIQSTAAWPKGCRRGQRGVGLLTDAIFVYRRFENAYNIKKSWRITSSCVKIEITVEY